MDFSKFRDTGELSDILVQVEDKEYKLHKFPLYIKSDFFRALARSTMSEKDRVELAEFPGGVENFEVVANYCYNIKIDITKENVCQLRCAAEFLQMSSPGNLSDVTDRFLQDVLTTAKLGRSIGVIVELLQKCCGLSEIAEQSKIVEKCITALVDYWLISSKYTKRIQPVKSVSSDLDFGEFTDISRLPLNWFLQLYTVARDKSVRPVVLANLIQVYITSAAAKHKSQIQKKKGDFDQIQHDSKTKVVDDKGSESGDKEEEETGDEKEDENALLDSGKVLPEDDGAPGEDIGVVLDALLLDLSDSVPLAENVSPEWVAEMLGIADSEKCECRPVLLKLAGRLLHRFSPKELSSLSTDLLREILEEAAKDPQNIQSENVCQAIDEYLYEMATKNELSVENFSNMVGAVPSDYRNNHDTLFGVLETLLKSDDINVTEDEKQTLLELVDFSKLSETTLQRAYESGLVPSSYITKAALGLCSRLRTELETAKSIIRSQEDELEKYGLGGRGSAWLKSIESVPYLSPKSEKYCSMGQSKYTSNVMPTLSSDLEYQMAMDALDRSLGRNEVTVATTSYSSQIRPDGLPNYSSSTYPSFLADRARGVDTHGDIYRRQAAPSAFSQHTTSGHF